MKKWSNVPAERFFEAVKVNNFAVSNDEGKIVFTANIKGKPDLWCMDLSSPYPYPLTFEGQAIGGATFSSDNSMIAYASDFDGNENYQLYMIKSTGSEPIRLTEGDQYRNELCQITEDGKIYYSSNRANPAAMNIFTYDIEKDEHVQLFEDEVTCFCAKVFEKEGYVYYVKAYANTFVQSWLYDLKTGTHILLSPEDVPHVSKDAVFINDKEILFSTNLNAKYAHLMKYNLQTKEFEIFLQEEGEIESISISKDKKWLCYVVEKGVEDILYVMNMETKENRRIKTDISAIESIQFGPESGDIYILGLSSISTANIYGYKVQENEIVRLTNNLIPCIDPEHLVEPETVYYKSFDGLEIEGLIFKAKVNDNGHWIIWPHGGAQAAERKSYRAMFQYFLNNGYSIFAPNFRGSATYGSEFVKLVEGDWGHGPRLDMVEGVKWLVNEGYAQEDKLFVLGGSYGGYMSLLLHGRHAELWKGVVDIFGPSSLFSFVNSVPEYWKPLMKQMVGDVEKDAEKFTNDSPITYLDQMVKPMLVIQGANDPRVVKAESDQIVEKLREKGRKVEYMVLDDEGHGFSKRENEIKVCKAIVDFLNSLI